MREDGGSKLSIYGTLVYRSGKLLDMRSKRKKGGEGEKMIDWHPIHGRKQYH